MKETKAFVTIAIFLSFLAGMLPYVYGLSHLQEHHKMNDKFDTMEKVDITNIKKDINRLEQDYKDIKDIMKCGIAFIAALVAVIGLLLANMKKSDSTNRQFSSQLEKQELVSIQHITDTLLLLANNLNSHGEQYKEVLRSVNSKVDTILSPEIRLFSNNPESQYLALEELFAKGTKKHISFVDYYISKKSYGNEELKLFAGLVKEEIKKSGRQ